MTSYNSSPPNASPPQAITLEVRASTYEFGRNINIQFIMEGIMGVQRRGTQPNFGGCIQFWRLWHVVRDHKYIKRLAGWGDGKGGDTFMQKPLAKTQKQTNRWKTRKMQAVQFLGHKSMKRGDAERGCWGWRWTPGTAQETLDFILREWWVAAGWPLVKPVV